MKVDHLELENRKVRKTIGRNIFLIAAMPKDVREELRKAEEAAQRAGKYAELEELEKKLDPESWKMQEATEMIGILPQFAQGTVSLAEIAEQLEAKEPTPEPTPEEIKHQLKYEKNPMRIKQLNRQLTQAYRKRKQAYKTKN